MTNKALLLFDIDGTLLVRGADAHKEAVHAALKRVYGVADPSRPRIEAAGKTDLEISREILVASGVPARVIGERGTEFRVAAVEEYASRCPRDLSDRVAPVTPPPVVAVTSTAPVAPVAAPAPKPAATKPPATTKKKATKKTRKKKKRKRGKKRH